MERHLTVVVAEHDCEIVCVGWDESSLSTTFNQSVHSMDDLLKQQWFITYLKDKGFYNKDETNTENLSHLNNFVYKYGAGNYKYYTENLSDLKAHNCDVLRVYQEVVGADRLHGISKIIAARDKYMKKEAELVKKTADKKEAVKVKAKQRKLEEARQLLEEEGLLSDKHL